MKKTILTSIAAIAFAMPAIAANIPNNATCNSDVLGVSSGSANLEADYTANTINITWDGNGGSTPTGGASSCTYDSTFNLPSAPTKTGYTFAGWAVQAQCSLSGLNANTNGIDYLSKNFASDYCYYYNDDTGDEIDDDCTDSTFSGLSAGEWQTNFSYGSIKGIAKCSAKQGNNNSYTWNNDSSNWSATTAELDAASGDARYCWCQATSYTATGSSQCNVASPSWVFSNDSGSASHCASFCAYICADRVQTGSDFRRALFGIQ